MDTPEHKERGPRPFACDIDHQGEVIRIQGILYTFSLFDALAFAPTGAKFEIGTRRDGAITLLHLAEPK